MPTFDMLPTPATIIRHLDRFVHGQQRAKRDLATAVYRHYLSLAYRHRNPEVTQPFGRRHVLLLGPTGAGKTFLVSTLAKYLGVPLAFVSATGLVEAGYTGEHLDGVFRRLLSQTRGDIDTAQRGIVFLDEIDKIRRQDVGGQRDVSGEGVQTSLLSVLDGCPMEVRMSGSHFTVDTSHILFICTGAFVGLSGIIRRRLGTGRTLGFHTAGADDASDLTEDQALARGELQDLQEYGFIPEFLGRFAVISRVLSLSREDLIGVLKSTEESPLHRQRRWFEEHGIELVVPDEALGVIAEIAITNGTNARGLDRVLTRILAPIDWQLPNLAEKRLQRVTLTPEAAAGRGEPCLEYAHSAGIAGKTAATSLREDAALLLNHAALPAAPSPAEVAASRQAVPLPRATRLRRRTPRDPGGHDRPDQPPLPF